MAALLWAATEYRRSARWRVEPSQQPLVDRALRDAAAAFDGNDIEKQRRISYPVVTEYPDRTCVALISTRRDGGGEYVACYARKDGRRLYERATVA